MSEVSKKILFKKDAEYNGIKYLAGVAYDLPAANGYADRWISRGHSEVVEADPEAIKLAEEQAKERAEADVRQKEKDEKAAKKQAELEAKELEKVEKAAKKQAEKEAKEKEEKEYAELEAEEKAKAELAAQDNQDNGASAL